MTIAAEIPVTYWHGCYDDSWKGLITDESFAHPAKFAPGLIRRILQHGIDRGWWKRGDLLGDPFGGIAGGGIMAGYAGLNWIGVELEERFVALGNANIAKHAPTWLACGDASFVTLQGDSRRFAEIVREVAGVVTSPPYAQQVHGANGIDAEKLTGNRAGRNSQAHAGAYGETAGQIGGMPTGSVEAVVSSPPFTTDQPCQSQSKLNGNIAGRAKRETGMTSDGNIQTLPAGNVASVVTSPPYASCDTKPTKMGTGKASRADGDAAGRNKGDYHYPNSKGQIGNLKEGDVAGIATSPPWETGCEGAIGAHKFKDPEAFARKRAEMDELDPKCHSQSPESRIAQFERDNNKTYGTSEGQIAKESGETYWQAMHAVYGQCLAALRPGGVMAIVVKDYVKDRQRVPLCDQTLLLLTSLGFEPVERVHAMLVKETTRAGLFGTETKRTERKSFFRRLAEKKGSPRIDWEEVIVVRKAVIA